AVVQSTSISAIRWIRRQRPQPIQHNDDRFWVDRPDVLNDDEISIRQYVVRAAVDDVVRQESAIEQDSWRTRGAPGGRDLKPRRHHFRPGVIKDRPAVVRPCGFMSTIG